jgi:DNA-binding protein HU-beta
MTKSELIDEILSKTTGSKKDITLIIEEVFESISETLAKGEKCTFPGFGVFEVKDRAAREGRNPQDPAKTLVIPAKRVPVFRPGKGLKEKVMGAE